MSSIIERLTEGVVNRDMRAEGSALLNKWEKTGLLEGLDKDRHRSSMARLLENQAKELLRESSSMAGGDVEGFAAVAFPIVRRVFAGLIANDLVSVQPMSLPSGLIFFLDFVFSPNLGASSSQTNRMGNVVDKSIYGTNQVGSQITGGVDLVGATLGADFSGPRTVGARGYAYASPTGSQTCATTMFTVADQFSLTGSTELQRRKWLQYDPDIMALSSSGDPIGVAVFECRADQISGSSAGQSADYDNLGAFSASFAANTGITNQAKVIRRLTMKTGSGETDNVRFVVLGYTTTSVVAQGGVSANGAAVLQFPITDRLTTSNALGSVVGAALWGL